MITVVVLAAGASSRMGQPKALLEENGVTYLAKITATARGAGATSVAVVAGPPDGDKIKAKLPVGAGWVWNHDPSRGMITSVQIAISGLPPRTLACMVWPVDVPNVESATVRAIMSAPAGKIVVPRYKGKGGHPVRLPAKLFGEIAALPNETSLKQFIDAHPADTIYLDVEDEWVTRDFDTPADVKKAKDDKAAAKAV